MTSDRRRHLTSLVLKILSLFLVVIAAYLSRAVQLSDASRPKEPQAIQLRSIGAVHPRISPSGSDVVFSYQGGIWRMPLGPADSRRGRVMKRLVAGAGFAFEPSGLSRALLPGGGDEGVQDLEGIAKKETR